MTESGVFPVEPWHVRETRLDLDLLAQSESVFALSNGHIGLRGNLDEGEPHGIPGTYLNSFYELRPLPYAEARLRLSRSPGQTIVNVTNGKLIRLLVDDEPFDVRYGELLAARAGPGPAGRHPAPQRRVGVAGRPAGPGPHRRGWCRSPSGRSPRSTTRSRPVDGDAPADPAVRAGGQRAAAAASQRPAGGGRAGHAAGGRGAGRPATAARCWCTAPGAAGCGWPPAWTTLVEAPGQARASRPRPTTTGPRTTVAVHARAGRAAAGGQAPRVRLVQPRGPRRRCATRSPRRWPAPGYTGWDGPARRAARLPRRLLGRRRRRGRRRPGAAAGGPVRAVPRAAGRRPRRAPRPIPAKGLTGPGYDGHAFWDTETFVLPVLTYTQPRRGRRRAALAALHPRAGPGAGRRRSACAARRSRGAPSAAQECSAYWPAGTAAFHINADIADAVDALPRRPPATTTFERECGLELLVETARLWLLARPPRPPRRAATSTASPARTSTPRSPTTTSTPT